MSTQYDDDGAAVRHEQPAARVVVASPRVEVIVTDNVGKTGQVGLTVATGGEHVTVALSVDAVGLLMAALAAARGDRAEVAR